MGKHKQKTSRSRRVVCCNPFSKPGHSNWRRFSKLRSVTQNMLTMLKNCESVSLPEIGDLICNNCRLQITCNIPSCEQGGDTDDDIGINVPEVESCERIPVDKNEQLNEVLQRLGLDRIKVNNIRSKAMREKVFKEAVSALKCLLEVDLDVHYEDTEVPIVQDLLKSYAECSKVEKFKLLTLLAPSWSRNKMITKTGCSK